MKIIAPAFVFLLLCAAFSFPQQYECDYSAEIIAGNDTADFKWKMKAVKIWGMPANITGTAKIYDLRGNIVKNYRPWSSLYVANQKTSPAYSPGLDAGEYKIEAEIKADCYDTNKDNNVAVKTVKIKNANAAESADFKVEDDRQSTAIKNKTGNLPVQKITQSDIDAEEKYEAQEKNESSVKAENKQSEIIYESSSEKAAGMIILFLLMLSILLNILLIWKR